MIMYDKYDSVWMYYDLVTIPKLYNPYYRQLKKKKNKIENWTARFPEFHFNSSIQIHNDGKFITKIHSDIVIFSFHICPLNEKWRTYKL